jgi:glycolate oxidase iron-sulfur subunit
MQTHLADWIKDSPDGREAEAILRKCVHCGFCNATCPTYQLLGDELDGPRGRIYLMKEMLEGAPVTRRTQLHLDRCLTCRNCETTCPSGVQYGRLLDVGRKLVGERVARPLAERMKQRAIAALFSRRAVFGALTQLGRLARPFVPRTLASKLPRATLDPGRWPAPRHARRMIALAGCVQPALAPQTNAAAARVLDRLGISLIEARGAGCCGALRFHLDRQEEARADMRALIDAWWPLVEAGAEAIVMTASGCGVTVKDYAHLLADDPAYAARAQRISALARDLSEVFAGEHERLAAAVADAPATKVAFHPPCTLQHGQRIKGVIEGILVQAGFRLVPVADAHLCCGSAGAYSILQPELSEPLKNNKLTALQAHMPDLIVTANIGCEAHLAGGANVPVQHWVVALDARLRAV